MNDIGFDDLAATVPALGNITLASIPLKRPGRVDRGALRRAGHAAGGRAAPERHPSRLLRPADDGQSRDARDEPIAPITLGDLDLSQSPLGSLPASAIVLANVKLSDLGSLQTWCDAFGRAYCSSPSDLTGETVMSAALQGAPVNDVRSTTCRSTTSP